MRVVIAEDHAMFRDVLVAVCSELQYDITGATGNGGEALALCSGRDVDVLILDMQLDDVSGGVVIETLERERKSTRVVVLSAHIGDYLIHRLEGVQKVTL